MLAALAEAMRLELGNKARILPVLQRHDLQQNNGQAASAGTENMAGNCIYVKPWVPHPFFPTLKVMKEHLDALMRDFSEVALGMLRRYSWAITLHAELSVAPSF